MSFTKNQLILIGGAGFLVLIFILISIGLLPGKQQEGPPKIKAQLEFWGIGDEKPGYTATFDAFKKSYPGTTINYRNFSNSEDYETAILESLASGKGPDIFMIQNTSLSKQINKITPVPSKSFSASQLKEFFPKIVEQNFTNKGAVYALPLSIDSLALFYNKELLNQGGVAVLPKDWKEFQDIIPKLTKSDSNKNIITAGAAIGGSEKNINHATNLLYLLMLQSGTQMVNKEFTSASFASKDGENALKFYTSFTDQQNEFFTWNDKMINSLEAFEQEKVAMIFNYASVIPQIKKKYYSLDFGIAPIPQPQNASTSISYANYWGYAVSKQSKNPAIAWDFIIALTTDKNNAEKYLEMTKKPPALKTLIDKYQNNSEFPEFSVFTNQALIAKSWPQINPEKTREVFSNAIEKATINPKEISEILREAEDQITELMTKKTF